MISLQTPLKNPEKWTKTKRRARDIRYRKDKRLAAHKLLMEIGKTLMVD